MVIFRDSDVKFRNKHKLCMEEVDFIAKRKKLVFDNMKKQEFKNLIHENNVSIFKKKKQPLSPALSGFCFVLFVLFVSR